MNVRTAPEPELMDRELAAPDSAAIVAISRAEIDGQIATARAFPRSIATFMREARELVSVDEATAEACIYSLPRGRDDDGNKKFLTGPSVRFAEIIMYSFGNNRTGGRVVAIERDSLTAQGVFHDLEKNVQVTKEVQRSITDKYGKRYKADMIGVTSNAGISIALRNAVLAGIPQALWLPIYEAARMVAVGDVTTLGARRTNALAWFGKLGISPERIFAQLGVQGIEDVGVEQLETLIGLKTAIRRGDVTPEAAFTQRDAPATNGTVSELAERLKQRGEAEKPAGKPEVDATKLKGRLHLAETLDALDEAAADISLLPVGEERDECGVIYDQRKAALTC